MENSVVCNEFSEDLNAELPFHSAESAPCNKIGRENVHVTRLANVQQYTALLQSEDNKYIIRLRNLSTSFA